MNISFLKEKGNKYLVVVLLGILVLIMFMPSTDVKKDSVKETESAELSDVEEQLKKVLTAMEGVGDVEVMVTTRGKSNGIFGTDDQEETKVCGVVVVAEGAGNATVEARISNAVKALFSIESHKISIVKMRSQGDVK